MLPTITNLSLNITKNSFASSHNFSFDQPSNAIKYSSLTLQLDLLDGSYSQSTNIVSLKHSFLSVNITNTHVMLTLSKTIHLLSIRKATQYLA